MNPVTRSEQATSHCLGYGRALRCEPSPHTNKCGNRRTRTTLNNFGMINTPKRRLMARRCVGVLISLWLFLFAAQPKEFLLDGLKKLEQRSHKCVELRGEYVE
jgi:hypothetical protein